MQITDVYVGGARESLRDRVSPSLPLSPIITQLGKYLKVIVVLETNVDMMLQCDKCGRWRLLYSKKKLKKHERDFLKQRRDGLMHMYTCGASLEDLHFDPPLNKVYVRDVCCSGHIEKLYDSAGYEPICIYCACEMDGDADCSECFPQCSECKQPKIKKR